MKVVIIGAGAVGAACAYFLSRRGAEVVVVERAGIACAASGKSGGFLARDWCDGSPLDGLARRSFALHRALAGKIAGDWGYRAMTTYSGTSCTPSDGARGGGPLPWLSDAVSLQRQIGSATSTAQVHPARFTEALMHAAREAGARMVIGRATGLATTGAGAGTACGVVVDGAAVAADRVVLAMGPWSLSAGDWVDLPAVRALKGHSIVFAAPGVPAEALFLEHREADGRTSSPEEIFPRDDGTVYACAISSDGPLPDDPAETGTDVGAIERLEAICHAISPVLSPDRVIAGQACHRPVTGDGLPFIGRVAGTEGVVVATGHGVWGILNAPGTGEAVAELILDGATRSVDISPFDPARLPSARRGGKRPSTGTTARRMLGRQGASRQRE